MKTITWPQKAPTEVLDYTADLTILGIAAAGDVVQSVAAGPSIPPGLTVDSVDRTLFPLVTAWLSGGTHGTRYEIPILTTTAAGRVELVTGLIDIIDPNIALADRVGPNMAAGA